MTRVADIRADENFLFSERNILTCVQMYVCCFLRETGRDPLLPHYCCSRKALQNTDIASCSLLFYVMPIISHISCLAWTQALPMISFSHIWNTQVRDTSLGSCLRVLDMA